MSVVSEFTRHVRRCTDLLETSDAPGAVGLATSLHAARAIASSDLSAAAERVLALAASTPSAPDVDFLDPSERDAFSERFGHTLAVCRAILGRSGEG